jgi:hypothetical protein
MSPTLCLQGLRWMVALHDHGLSGILADDMGLGKTVQIIALVAYLVESRGSQGPFLVAAPASVLPNWAAEFKRWAPDLKVTRPCMQCSATSTCQCFLLTQQVRRVTCLIHARGTQWVGLMQCLCLKVVMYRGSPDQREDIYRTQVTTKTTCCQCYLCLPSDFAALHILMSLLHVAVRTTAHFHICWCCPHRCQVAMAGGPSMCC